MREKYSQRIIYPVIFILIPCIFVLDIDGVHRWLRLPIFTLNIAAIVIPITIVDIYRLIEEENFAISVLGIIVVAFLLYLQPDASQLLAFSLPMIILLLKSNISQIIKGSFSVILFFLTFKSWFCLDTLQPVNYTEGILTMLNDLSILLYIIGILVSKKFVTFKKPMNPSRFQTHPAAPELSALCVIPAVFLKA